ncbi:YezD family protein [Hephaestia sp. GCM10023244]|uniref:YezD family protein n=1 Tax=unclassified Hephaestia TaxID=2631281 RepID=UPI00207738CD|nr:YezD family protein [Hephaestia sp. MAHUQ-44]MCM8731942.1 YezD family protein [Hephaestia sp. MAHUQ-44]
MSVAPQRLAVANADDAQIERAVTAVRDALRRLRFGCVALTVHDGQVTQIEISEKHRLGN